MAYTLPQLSYAYNALEPHIDKQTMTIHHTKHHQAYVDKLNDALAKHIQLADKSLNEHLGDLSGLPEEIRSAVRNNGGGHLNHSLFWELLVPDAPLQPAGELTSAIDRAFGSFSNFQQKFTDAALARFGSGWAWLLVQEKTLVIGSTVNQDTPAMGKDIAGLSGTPILALDVWEHAYYLKYQNRRAEYVDAFWHVVNWQEVQRRYEEAT